MTRVRSEINLKGAGFVAATLIPNRDGAIGPGEVHVADIVAVDSNIISLLATVVPPIVSFSDGQLEVILIAAASLPRARRVGFTRAFAGKRPAEPTDGVKSGRLSPGRSADLGPDALRWRRRIAQKGRTLPERPSGPKTHPRASNGLGRNHRTLIKIVDVIEAGSSIVFPPRPAC